MGQLNPVLPDRGWASPQGWHGEVQPQAGCPQLLGGAAEHPSSHHLRGGDVVAPRGRRVLLKPPAGTEPAEPPEASISPCRRCQPGI